MRKLLILLAFLATAAAVCAGLPKAEALTDVQRTLLFSAPRAYLGMVATRGNIASAQNTGLHYGNSRSWHIARDNISTIGVVFGNWRNSTEIVVGLGSATYTASIEYPANNLTQVTWSGNGSVTLASGQQILSDMITLPTPIPRGAMFWIRNFQVQPTGILFDSAGPLWTASGDALEYSGTVIADQTAQSKPYLRQRFRRRPAIPLRHRRDDETTIGPFDRRQPYPGQRHRHAGQRRRDGRACAQHRSVFCLFQRGGVWRWSVSMGCWSAGQQWANQ
jgi:hypothetical protein